jgi:hypothetical protein
MRTRQQLQQGQQGLYGPSILATGQATAMGGTANPYYQPQQQAPAAATAVSSSAVTGSEQYVLIVSQTSAQCQQLLQDVQGHDALQLLVQAGILVVIDYFALAESDRPVWMQGVPTLFCVRENIKVVGCQDIYPYLGQLCEKFGPYMPQIQQSVQRGVRLGVVTREQLLYSDPQAVGGVGGAGGGAPQYVTSGGSYASMVDPSLDGGQGFQYRPSSADGTQSSPLQLGRASQLMSMRPSDAADYQSAMYGRGVGPTQDQVSWAMQRQQQPMIDVPTGEHYDVNGYLQTGRIQVTDDEAVMMAKMVPAPLVDKPQRKSNTADVSAIMQMREQQDAALKARGQRRRLPPQMRGRY